MLWGSRNTQALLLLWGSLVGTLCSIECKIFKEQHTIKLQEQEVGYTDTFKYLGVEIDDLLSMKSHDNRVNKNASHKLFLLRKLRHVLNTHAATLVLKSMFLGVLDYGLLFTTVVPIKVRLRWFGADLVKLQYLCHLSWDLNVLYIK